MTDLAFFEEFKVRRHYDEKQQKWFFSVIDIVAVLTDQPDYDKAKSYWTTLKSRLKKEGSEVVTDCHQLKIMAQDGKMRETDVADLQAIFRLVQSVPSKKAEPIKLWLAKIGNERIDKEKLKREHLKPENPYEIALRYCIEGAYSFLKDKNEHNKITHIIIEKRGTQEDNDLELAFLRIIQGDNFRENSLFGLELQFEMVFADKKINSSGLQIADLMAYPIGSHFLRPEKINKAYEIVKKKIYNGEGNIKILP